MTKERCLEKMKYVRDAFWFSLGAYGLAVKEPTSRYLSNYNLTVSDKEIYVLSGNEVAATDCLLYNINFSNTLDNGSAKMFVKQTFYYMILETFEAAKSYAFENNKSDHFRSQEWYAFARHLRNAIGHNGVWSIKGIPNDLPTTFRNKTIDLSFNGQELDDFIGWVYGLQLCATIQLWVGES
ncbi:hypothetical protein [Acinetobacter sp. YH12063]|uniref:hypothetical protein n=1 Tax=Acinetobacter sp. YH12063 TaxID=2601061 RepID=UPI0015D0F353|nr:hypothetical protein [Acinetobacter sp. YH12063]